MRLITALFGWLAILCVTASVALAHEISVEYGNASLHGRTNQAPDNDIGNYIADLRRIYPADYSIPVPDWPIIAYRPILGGVPAPHWLRPVYQVKINGSVLGNVSFDCWVEYGGHIYNYDISGQVYHDAVGILLNASASKASISRNTLTESLLPRFAKFVRVSVKR